MVSSHQEVRPTLAMMLAARARRASDTRLTIDAVVGLLLATMLVFWRPTAWPLWTAAATCVLAFGLWGIADRALAEARDDARRARVHRVLRGAAAVLGAAAGVALALLLLGVALGTWIS